MSVTVSVTDHADPVEKPARRENLINSDSGSLGHPATHLHHPSPAGLQGRPGPLAEYTPQWYVAAVAAARPAMAQRCSRTEGGRTERPATLSLNQFPHHSLLTLCPTQLPPWWEGPRLTSPVAMAPRVRRSEGLSRNT